MIEEDIKKFILENRFFLDENQTRTNPSFLLQKSVISYLLEACELESKDDLKQRIYQTLTGIQQPKCKVCDNLVPYSGFFGQGYGNGYCSTKCAKQGAYILACETKSKINPNWKHDEHAKRVDTQRKLGTLSKGGKWTEERRKKRKKDSEAFWRSMTPDKLASWNEEHRKTNLEKYGVISNLRLPEVIQKAKNLSNTEEAKNKAKQTRVSNFYELLLGSRLNYFLEPMFTKEEYTQSKNREKYSFKCKHCDIIFEDTLYSGKIPKCPICFKDEYSTRSSMERSMVDFLVELKVVYKLNDRTEIYPKELDFFIPLKNLAIEMNGNYYHSEIAGGKDKNYHLDKYNHCSTKGIRCLFIREDEWLTKNEIVKSIIKSALGMYDKKIGARLTVSKKISSKDANLFYKVNHIQGSTKAEEHFGLFLKDELVSCISFGRNRFKKDSYEITRFANKLGYSVNGAFSKLMRLWDNRGILYTYADKRYFTGKVYETVGFIKQEDSPPSYVYTHLSNRMETKNRFNYMKHRLKESLNFDESLSEWQIMQLDGYDRIWDCGNAVYVRVVT